MKRIDYVAIRSDQWDALFATIRLIPSLTALQPEIGHCLAARLECRLRPALHRGGIAPEPEIASTIRIAAPGFHRAIVNWTIEAEMVVRQPRHR